MANLSHNVVTPRVVGAPSAFEAARTLSKAGLALGVVSERVTRDVTPGSIVDQTPPADTEVAEGTAIDVIVAVSRDRVTVPSVIGLTVERAEAVLDAQGLGINVTARRVDPRALVNGQDPASGENVNKGTAIQVFIPVPTPAPARPDLTVETLGIDRIGDDVVLTVAVSNAGRGEAPATVVEASVTGLEPVRTPISPLAPGKTITVQIPLAITDAVRGTSVFGTVVVDPGDDVPESD